MRLCWNREELGGAYEAVKHLAQNNFKDAGLFLEKFVEDARHIEVQIFGDGKGEVLALGGQYWYEGPVLRFEGLEVRKLEQAPEGIAGEEAADAADAKPQAGEDAPPADEDAAQADEE